MSTGGRSATEPGRRRVLAGVAGLVGGLAAVAGAVLPWYSVDLTFVTGVIHGLDTRDGFATLALGAVELAFGIALLGTRSPGRVRTVGALIAVTALTGVASAVIDLDSHGLATVAVGLYLVVAGNALALVGGIVGIWSAGRTSDLTTPPVEAVGATVSRTK